MEFTKTERLILSNQFRILKSLDPNEAQASEVAIEILENGYELHYDGLLNSFEDGMTADECSEVLDILDMYRSLSDAHRTLPDMDDVDATHLAFRGFDGNNETARMCYVRFLVEVQRRWQDLNIVDFNSHAPRLPRYRQMVERWRATPNRQQLTKADLLRIIA